MPCYDDKQTYSAISVCVANYICFFINENNHQNTRRILYVLCCHYMILFWYEEWIWWRSFKNRQACRYPRPPIVETGYCPDHFTRIDIKRSATKHVSFSLWICLFEGCLSYRFQRLFITRYSGLTLMIFSSTINSKILVFL